MMVKVIRDDQGKRHGCIVENADGGYDEEEARYVVIAPKGFVFLPHRTKTMTVYHLGYKINLPDPENIGRRCLSDLKLTAE